MREPAASRLGGGELHYSVAKGALFADSHGYTRLLLMKVGTAGLCHVLVLSRELYAQV